MADQIPNDNEEEIDLQPSPAIIIQSIAEQKIVSDEWYEEDPEYGPFVIPTPPEDTSTKSDDS